MQKKVWFAEAILIEARGAFGEQRKLEAIEATYRYYAELCDPQALPELEYLANTQGWQLKRSTWTYRDADLDGNWLNQAKSRN